MPGLLGWIAWQVRSHHEPAPAPPRAPAVVVSVPALMPGSGPKIWIPRPKPDPEPTPVPQIVVAGPEPAARPLGEH